MVAAIFDVDQELVSAARANLPNGTELLGSTLREHLKTDLDALPPLLLANHVLLLPPVLGALQPHRCIAAWYSCSDLTVSGPPCSASMAATAARHEVRAVKY